MAYGTPVLLLVIGVGGAAGTWARFRLAGAIYDCTGRRFPWGTLTVNVLGSFLLGVLLPLLDTFSVPSPLRAFLTVGCIGAFTTFSTFAYEAASLLMAGARRTAALYAAASVTFGLLALLAGLGISGR